MFQQSLDGVILAESRKTGTDGDFDLEILVLVVHGFHRLTDTVGQQLGSRLLGVTKQDDKFFSAIAVNNVTATHTFGHAFCHPFQNGIAGDMAIGVVNLLEFIDIKNNYR